MRMTLTRDQLGEVEENLLNWSSDYDVTIRSAYGGRGMYGATCVGVVHKDSTTPAAFLYFLAEELGMDFLELMSDLGGGSRDSMGLSTITYWRNLTVDGATDEEDD